MSRMLAVVDSALGEFERRNNAAEYYNSPEKWAQYMLGATLWSKQREVCDSVVNNKSTAVRAGHGVSKSFTAALLACWWTDTRYPDAFVVSTAPSLHQVSAILWREIRTMYKTIEARYNEGLIDHKLPGYITSQNEWKDSDGKLIGFGRKPPDQDTENAMQGIHGKVLAIGDEACGLDLEMIDALSNITSNEGSRRLLIGNPTDPSSHFAKIFRDNTGAWKLIAISVLESPNFTDEKYELPQYVLDALTGPEYVEDKKLEYGEDSARYKARVLGEFAFDNEDSLITPEDIETAKKTELDPAGQRSVLGVDVARMGKDASAVYINTAGHVRLLDSWSKTLTTETALRIHRLALDHNAEEVRVDSIGIGAGVADQLEIMEGRTYTLVRMDSGAASPNRLQWHNARAFWWDNVRSKLRQGQIDLDPEDEAVQDELMTPRYSFNKSSGGLVIESKDEMRKRGVSSPDLADSFVFAATDLTPDDNSPLAGLSKGTRIYSDASDILGGMPDYLNVIREVWL